MQILKPLSGKLKSIFRGVQTACKQLSRAVSVIQLKKGQEELWPVENKSSVLPGEKKQRAQLTIMVLKSESKTACLEAS